MIAPPVQSDEQRTAALKQANRVRFFRARLRERADRVEIAWQIADPDPLMETMQIGKLLLFVPGIGKVKRNAILTRCRISPSKTLGGMTKRQRMEMVVELGRRNAAPGDDSLARKLADRVALEQEWT